MKKTITTTDVDASFYDSKSDDFGVFSNWEDRRKVKEELGFKTREWCILFDRKLVKKDYSLDLKVGLKVKIDDEKVDVKEWEMKIPHSCLYFYWLKYLITLIAPIVAESDCYVEETYTAMLSNLEVWARMSQDKSFLNFDREDYQITPPVTKACEKDFLKEKEMLVKTIEEWVELPKKENVLILLEKVKEKEIWEKVLKHVNTLATSLYHLLSPEMGSERQSEVYKRMLRYTTAMPGYRWFGGVNL